MRKTITLEPEPERARPRRGFLTVAFVAGRPAACPLRLELGAAERVIVGRGDARSHRVDGRTITVELDDRTMSRPHVELQRTERGWVLIDRGSKNGTRVDGTRSERALLADGALIAMGGTFAVYRTASIEDGEAATDGTALATQPPALRTLHPVLEAQLRRVRRAARSDVSMLILGETGTGKELMSRAIHALSGRDGPFVAINCGAIPESLLAAELFGVRRGAFSGASVDRPGLVRAAHGGTLLLDEIGEMSASSQVALLRVLQEREVTPVGDTTPVRVDVRVLAATHRDLRRMVLAGQFRDDLLARLTGLVVTLPPLRDRREDLGLVVADILAEAGAPPDLMFTPDAAHLLFARAWRRNFRELRQAIAGAIAAGATRIMHSHLEAFDDEPIAERAGMLAVGHASAAKGSVDAGRLAALLEAHDDNLSAVARELSTSRTQVARLMERYALTRTRRST